MNVREYYEAMMLSVSKHTSYPLDRAHPNSDVEGETFGTIMAEMPLNSNCGRDCAKAIEHCAIFCQDIANGFGDDLPRLFETTSYALARTLSVYIRG